MIKVCGSNVTKHVKDAPTLSHWLLSILCPLHTLGWVTPPMFQAPPLQLPPGQNQAAPRSQPAAANGTTLGFRKRLSRTASSQPDPSVWRFLQQLQEDPKTCLRGSTCSPTSTRFPTPTPSDALLMSCSTPEPLGTASMYLHSLFEKTKICITANFHSIIIEHIHTLISLEAWNTELINSQLL